MCWKDIRIKEASEKFCGSCTPIEKWVNLHKFYDAIGLLSRNLGGRQGWAKFAGKKFPCRKAKSEMGNRRDRVFPVWEQALSLACAWPVQWWNHPLCHQRTRQLPSVGWDAGWDFFRLPDSSGLIFHSDQGDNIKTPAIKKGCWKKAFDKVCPEKGTVWMRLWKTSLACLN